MKKQYTENSTQRSKLGNEEGIALAMILVLSAISLAIIAGLIYMITSGTQISGMQKKYRTALEAGLGGADITYQLLSARGDPFDNLTELNRINYLRTASNDCLTAKLNQTTSATKWGACSDFTKTTQMTIDASDTDTYDFRFDLGGDPFLPTYRTYAKIVNTVEGNSGSGEGLVTGGVVKTSGEIPVMKVPYLYTIEVDAQNLNNPAERAKLSVLYQY